MGKTVKSGNLTLFSGVPAGAESVRVVSLANVAFNCVRLRIMPYCLRVYILTASRLRRENIRIPNPSLDWLQTTRSDKDREDDNND